MQDECILHVEDDPNDVLLVRRAFEKAGIKTRIEVAEDGQKAINYLCDFEKHAPPRILLLDIKLPGKDGFEVLEWLRHQPALRKLIVVFLTSSAIPGDITTAYDLGANSYCTKPVSPEELLDLAVNLKNWWFGPNLHAPLQQDLASVGWYRA
ncbi:MAG: two-component system response regulator [Verrucomicrobia bacterium]|nr:MAG: two-component system response regulator [Verrucomicrobiota bacterium]